MRIKTKTDTDTDTSDKEKHGLLSAQLAACYASGRLVMV